MKHRRWLVLRISAGYGCFVVFLGITPDFEYQPLSQRFIGPHWRSVPPRSAGRGEALDVAADRRAAGLCRRQ
jgi:hypothetical protein